MKLSELTSIYGIRDFAHQGLLSISLSFDDRNSFIDRLFLSSLDRFRVVSDVLLPFKSDIDPVDRSPVIYRLFDGAIRSSVEYRELLYLWKVVLSEAVKRDSLDIVRYLLEESFYKEALTSLEKLDLMKSGILSIEMLDYIIVEVLNRLSSEDIKRYLFDITRDVVVRDRDDLLSYLHERSKFKDFVDEQMLKQILSSLTIDSLNRFNNEHIMIPYYSVERLILYGVEFDHDIVELMSSSPSFVLKSLQGKSKEYLKGFTQFVKYLWDKCDCINKENIKFLVNERLVKEVGIQGREYTYDEMIMVLNNLI